MKQIKNESVTSLKKQIKNLTERNDNLSNKNYRLERDTENLNDRLNKMTDDLERAKNTSSFNDGMVQGINNILNRFQLDMTITSRNLSDADIKNIVNQRMY